MNADRRRKCCQIGAHLIVTSLALGVLAANASAQSRNPLRERAPVVTRDTAVKPAVAEEPSSASHRVAQAGKPTSRSTTRQVSYGYEAPRHATPSYVPRHEMVSGMTMESSVMHTQPHVPAEFMVEPMPMNGEIIESDCGAPVGDDCTSCGGCGTCNGCLIPCPTLTLNNFEFFAGANGFTGPPNNGETGSFGFYYGLNWAAPVPCVPHQAIGVQLGARGTSSNYSGAAFTDATRDQVFVTAGLFRRVDWGFQGGLVVDYLHDDWYYKASLMQLRGEMSWVYPQCHELGFWFTASTRSTTVEQELLNGIDLDINDVTYEPIDLFAFFYRRRFEHMCGGYGRFYAGFSSRSDGLIGADFKVPLTDSWALESGFTYLIPKDGDQRIAHRNEAWNVAVGLVWYPGLRKATGNDYFRPLFNVADNGSFMLNRL